MGVGGGGRGGGYILVAHEALEAAFGFAGVEGVEDEVFLHVEVGCEDGADVREGERVFGEGRGVEGEGYGPGGRRAGALLVVAVAAVVAAVVVVVRTGVGGGGGAMAVAGGAAAGGAGAGGGAAGGVLGGAAAGAVGRGVHGGRVSGECRVRGRRWGRFGRRWGRGLPGGNDCGYPAGLRQRRAITGNRDIDSPPLPAAEMASTPPDPAAKKGHTRSVSSADERRGP